MANNLPLLLNLLGSFIGDQEPKRNPNFDPNDPNSSPYSSPGFGTRFFHPEVAQYEAGQNNQWAMRDAEAVAKAKAALAGDKALLEPIADVLPDSIDRTASVNRVYNGFGGLNREKEAFSYGKTDAPTVTGTLAGQTDIADSNRKLSEAKFNLEQTPTVLSTRDFTNRLDNIRAGFNLDQEPVAQNIIEAKNKLDLATTTHALDRNDVIEATRDSDAVNQLSASLKLEPERIQAAINHYRGVNQRNPTYQEVESLLLNNQKAGAEVDAGILATKKEQLPAIRQTLSNTITGDLWRSRFVEPSQVPFGSRVNNDGTITPLAKREDYVNPMIANMEPLTSGIKGMGIGGVKGTKGESITLPGGRPLMAGGGNVDPMTGDSIAATKGTVQPTVAGSIYDYPVAGKTATSTKQQPKEMMNFDQFMTKLKVGKREDGNVITPQDAVWKISKYMAEHYKLPESMQQHFGDSTIKRPDASVYYNAFMGKDKSFTWQDAFSLLKSLPAEEQNKIYKQALN